MSDVVTEYGCVKMALTIDVIVRFAEEAAAKFETAIASGATADQNVRLRSGALGLLLLAELGATAFGAYADLPPSVDVGANLADGEQTIAPYETLLRRLGWERNAAYVHRACDPLEMVYTR